MSFASEIRETVAEAFAELGDASESPRTKESVTFSRENKTFTVYDPATNSYTAGPPTTVSNVEILPLTSKRMDRENTPLTDKELWILVEAAALGTFVPQPNDNVLRGTVSWRARDVFDPTGAIHALYRVLIVLP